MRTALLLALILAASLPATASLVPAPVADAVADAAPSTPPLEMAGPVLSCIECVSDPVGPCYDCIVIRDPCELVQCDAICNVCPPPAPTCYQPGEQPTGLVPMTVHFAQRVGYAACWEALATADLGLDAAAIALDYGADQVASLRDLSLEAAPLPPVVLMGDAAAELGAAIVSSACGAAIGDDNCAGSSAATATCSADVPESGGASGEVLDFAEESCEATEGTLDVLANAAKAYTIDARDYAMTVEGTVTAYAAERQGDAMDAARAAAFEYREFQYATQSVASYAVDAVCDYSLGSSCYVAYPVIVVAHDTAYLMAASTEF